MALILSLTATAVAAPSKQDKAPKSDNLKNPMAEKQAALKQTAREAVLKGKATARGANQVVKLGKGQYVELAFEGEDQILTVVGEFGTTEHPSYLGGTPGPLHNQIPPPDRTVDNTTIWAPDFSQEYYNNLLYNKGQVPSMANWYLAQSGGVYSVNGYATEWVPVLYNEARYGRNVCGDIVCTNVWRFVNDSADSWWTNLVAQKGSVAAANAFLATYDVWDRYDSDGDGNFNEPDGYIDHFQNVHAGEGEETGGGAQGEDAIWSHRWYANYPGSFLGPDGDGPNGFGGIKIGGSNYWVGDYTVEPENGGVGVFSHEFGHDLGLPDLYDTSGNTGGAENGTGWWTMWSQGSYGTIDNLGLGTYPVSATAWERYQLGWLRYGVGSTGKNGSFRLGPVEATTKQLQGLFVVLPDKEVTKTLGRPYAGDNFYYSGAANSLDTTMTRDVTLGAGPISLTAKVRYNIEEGYDYAYLMVDGTRVPTNLSNSSVVAEGIDSDTAGAWVNLTADLSAFAGGTHEIGFGYLTDAGVQGSDGSIPAGFAIDELVIPGQATDGAESDAGWVYDSNQTDQGFHITSGSETFSFFNAYVAEYRQYRSYDKALELGPYNFGFPAMPNRVEHFPLQDGLLIWYWDSSYADNNVGDHPGGGLLLPVDAHPKILHWTGGATIRPRVQTYDATFGLWKTDSITLHNPADGVAVTFPSLAAVTTFNDNNSYWVNGDPGDAPANGRYQSEWSSVNVPHTGTSIRVVSVGTQGSFMQVNVK
jgi:M6 family metalloprotease domain